MKVFQTPSFFLLCFLFFSCNGHKNKQTIVDGQKTAQPFFILTRYIHLKNALVEEDQEKAAHAGNALKAALEGFSTTQNKVQQLVGSSISQAENISKSSLEKQRQEFSRLSENIIKLIKITGTIKTLYVDYCPKYQNGNGGIWLSELKEIRNPYFGNKMLDCGQIKEKFKP